jgi:hypothetical protein
MATPERILFKYPASVKFGAKKSPEVNQGLLV